MPLDDLKNEGLTHGHELMSANKCGTGRELFRATFQIDWRFGEMFQISKDGP